MDRFLCLTSLTTHCAVLLVRGAHGEPKQITFGNATRTMVTSAALRRPQRMHMREQANTGEGALAGYSFGTRTREWARITAGELNLLGWEKQQAADMAKAALNRAGLAFGTTDTTRDLTKVLIFAPEDAAKNIAQTIDHNRSAMQEWLQKVQAAQEEHERQKKENKGKGKSETSPDEKPKLPPLPAGVKDGILTALAPADAIDIALFGRFLAEIAESPNVDGAVQTTAAITVGPAQLTEDFFSAADDTKTLQRSRPRQATDAFDILTSNQTPHSQTPETTGPNNGSGMTGYQALTSGTFCAVTVLDRVRLRSNLQAAGTAEHDAEIAAVAAEKALIEAFCTAVPTAKATTTAAPGVLPKFVLAFTATRPYNYLGAFEDAITEDGTEPASIQATRRLLDHHAMISRKRGLQPGRVLTYDLAITALLDDLRNAGTLTVTEVDSPDHLHPDIPAPAPTTPAEQPA
ncbi:type I-E CRISPR-associated protein Cas7/Cse4/CasC [Streptomyces sp. ISL-11]|uniref:type I-E CRISPR-associated protein Cas7/Cse4/CasC n=1 Tax=Streptomyces sp. ISL-11 TaxID=2819174 RepID=UPI001BED334D|nr:type I-E CRISPR-associated protein Cas7/Cse4/CasC [Streptomyces sp. ISL-11]MBT2384510.1 type I-E CRISPR-associated protein Cas7/Cse4/CasC [Streptomyces sp. ISL-11]